MRWLALPVVVLVALTSTTSRADSMSDPAGPDEQLLRAANVAIDDTSLLDVFRKRLLSPADRQRVEKLIGHLNDDAYKVREEASAELVEFGPAAVPLLRQALKSPALEVTRRAKKCIQEINPPSVEVLSAAARLLGLRRPAGALETLLTYLPVADDDELAAEIQAAITALAFEKGQPQPLLVQALKDRQALLRGAAVDALCQSGGRRCLSLVRPLLHDPDPDVRFRVAQHLADVREAEAIPVLIALLKTKGPTADRADGYLRELAESEAPEPTPGTKDASRQTCHDAWQRWWQAVDGPTLLKRIRQGTPDEAARQKATELIGQLGDDDFVTRERASENLVNMGPVAVPLLQNAAENSTDDEVAHRATVCLSRISQGSHPAITATTLRLLSLSKPPGTVSALLAYLPFANGADQQEEVQKALTAVAYVDGTPDPALLRGLHDSLALRRSAAGVALVEGTVRPAAAVRELLHDQAHEVQLHVALALVEHKDKSAVPALIDCLANVPAEQGWRAEEFLRRLAGASAPNASLGSNATAQRRCRDAWAAWWRTQGARVDMAALDRAPRQLGYTLIVQFMQWGNNSGRVYEIGPDKKVRWHVDGYNMPVDAQIVGGNHVLVADFYQSEVTERDLKGKTIWQQQANNPVSVQRLANGHTFIAGQSEIKEVERSGKVVYSFNPPGGACMAARKLRNGQIVAVSNTGMLSRVDTKGKLLKSFSVGNINWGGLDVLSNGHVLVAQQNMSKVVEYDLDGKSVWQVATNWPSSAVRLPSGNTLITSQNSQEILEVNRAGKTVWQYRTDGHPWHARRR